MKTELPLIIGLASVTLMAGAYLGADSLERRAHAPVQQARSSHLWVSPGESTLALITAEHRLMFSDLAWLEFVQVLGDYALGSVGDWDRIRDAAHMTADLDPRNLSAYESGGIVLAVYARRFEEAIALLVKGRKALPAAHQIPMALGYIEFFERKKPVEGANWMSEAAALPGAPTYLASLAGRMKFVGGDEAGAIALLESLIPNLEGPARESAEWRLKALRSEPILAEYDRACLAYRVRHGSLPDSAELFRAGAVGAPPVDAFGGAITFDAECVARTEEITKRAKEIATATVTLTIESDD